MRKLLAVAAATAFAVPLLVTGAQAAPPDFVSKLPGGPPGFVSQLPKGPPSFVDAPLPLAGGLPALAVMAGAVFMARRKRKND